MYTLVLLSGGIGSRMKMPIPKQYMLLAGKPVIMHVLEKVSTINEIEEIVIVCNDEYVASINLMLEQYHITKSVVFATAGDSRQASVFSGLSKVKTDNVIIHEAARPFVKNDDFKRLIDCEAENAMFGLPIPFTVIKGHENVEGLLDRDELVNVQLPQKFNTQILLDCHKKAVHENKLFTEDASLVFNYRPEEKIKIIDGMEYNIKLTTRMDMLLGEQIYEENFRLKKSINR